VDMGLTRFYTDLAGDITYELLIEDAIGCTIDTSIFIEDAARLVLELGEDQKVELGETVFLNPQVNFLPTGFLWSDFLINDCDEILDCLTQDFEPVRSQQVFLTLFTEGDCSISDSIFVEVINVRMGWFIS